MTPLIAAIGNSGSGKTTLVRALCQATGFTAALEQHGERPFQSLFAGNLQRYALANQIDYLLYRAQQEYALRQTATVGIVDGGLDLDFYGFTQLFRRRGYLSDAEYTLCQQLYTTLRSLLPEPDLYLYLAAPLPVVARRHAQRGRALEIAAQDDLAELDELVTSWMQTIDPSRLLVIDVTNDDYCTGEQLAWLLRQLDRFVDQG